MTVSHAVATRHVNHPKRLQRFGYTSSAISVNETMMLAHSLLPGTSETAVPAAFSHAELHRFLIERQLIRNQKQPKSGHIYCVVTFLRVTGPTFMPKVITVIIILKAKARASCHRAVYRPSPAGRSARLLPALVSDVLAG